MCAVHQGEKPGVGVGKKPGVGVEDAELDGATEEESGRISGVILDLVSWERTERLLFPLCWLGALLCQELLYCGDLGCAVSSNAL